jgi:hypothetical protein
MEMKGARAPYLEVNNDYFKALEDLGIEYDSSFNTRKKWGTNERYWPYTLD